MARAAQVPILQISDSLRHRLPTPKRSHLFGTMVRPSSVIDRWSTSRHPDRGELVRRIPKHPPQDDTPEEAHVATRLSQLRRYEVRREPVEFPVLDLDEEGQESVLRGFCPDFELRHRATGETLYLEVYTARNPRGPVSRRETRKRRRIDFLWRHYGVWVVWVDSEVLREVSSSPGRLNVLIDEASRAQRQFAAGKTTRPRWSFKTAA